MLMFLTSLIEMVAKKADPLHAALVVLPYEISGLAGLFLSQAKAASPSGKQAFRRAD
jgi:hypothetical protein